MSVRIEPEHVGGGAYVSEDGDGDIAITANNHEPRFASDTVYLTSVEAAVRMRDWLNRWLAERGHDAR